MRRKKLSTKLELIKKQRLSDPQIGVHLQLETVMHLLERLNLPKDMLAQAKEHEAHSIRIGTTMTNVQNGKPVRKQTLITIIERVLAEQEAVIKNPKQGDHATAALFQARKAAFEDFLQLVKSTRKEFVHLQGTARPMVFGLLREALLSHMHGLQQLLGKKKFAIYVKAMGRAKKIIMES